MCLRQNPADTLGMPTSRPRAGFALVFLCFLACTSWLGGCTRVVDAGVIRANRDFLKKANPSGSETGLSVDTISDQSLQEDGSLQELAFRVDGETLGSLACSTVLVATSSNESLVKSANIVIAGVLPNCTLSLSPEPNRHGRVAVAVAIAGASNTERKSFDLTVQPVNDTPWVSAPGVRQMSLAQEEPALVAVATAVDPDVDTDGQSLRYVVVTAPLRGILGKWPSSAALGGVVNYTPDAGFVGSDSFQYQMCDDAEPSACSEAVDVNISVTSVNEPPTDITLSNSSIAENGVLNALVGTLSATDPDSGDTFVYTLVAGDGDTDNSAFSVSASELRLNASADYEAKERYSLRVQAQDQGGSGLTFQKALTITVINVNDAPSLADVSDQSTDEDTVVNNIGVTIADPDGALVCSTALSAQSASSTLLPSGSMTVGGNYPSCTLSVAPAANEHGVATVTLTVSDGAGGSATETFALTVNPVNDAPSILAAGDQSRFTAQDTPVSLNLATGIDPDVASSGQGLTYLLSTPPSHGRLGDLPASATTLGSVTYTPDVGFVGADSFVYQICDSFSPPSCTAARTVNLGITNVNDAPTDISLAPGSLAENVGPNALAGTLSTTDPDAGDTFSYALVDGEGDTDNAAFSLSGDKLYLKASADYEAKASYSVRVQSTDFAQASFEKVLTITVTDENEAPTDIILSAATVAENAAANTAVGNLSSTDPDSGNTFTYALVAGTGDTDNSAFNISGSSLRLTGSANFEAKSSYSVRIRSTDGGGLWFEKAFTVTVSDVNEAPTDIALSNSTVAENAAANTAVGNLSSADPDSGNTFSYTLVAGTGDTDNAAFNISTNSLRLTGSANFEAKSSYSVRIRSTDSGGLWFEKAFTVTVTDVNETPTDIALSNSTVAENAAANTAVGNLSTTDPDTSNTFTYTLVAGTGDTDNAAFNISTNSLRLTGIANFEAKSSYSVRIRSTDAGGLWFEKAFTVTVTDVNETPTDLTLTPNTIAENAGANAVVGSLFTADPDSGSAFTYTLVTGIGDNDNAAFNISTSSLRLTASANFEAKSSYSVRVRSTDAGGLWFEKAFTVTVSDVNEAPTDIALSNSTVPENAAANSVVGNLSSTDPDTGLTFTYTLVAGAGDTDNTAFNISTDSLRLTGSANFEAKSSYSVRIRSTDGGGLWFEKAFTVTVTDVNEAPIDIALSSSTVAENAAANTAVGNLSSTDPDSGNTFTYTLVPGTGDTDNAAFNISTNSLRLTGSANFEAKSSYSVRIRSTDGGGLWFEKAFTVTVSDVNEAPTDIALSNSTVPENAAANTAVGNLSSTDPDSGSAFTYTLVAGTGDTDNAAFNISTTSLHLTGTANFEAKSSYSVRVRSTDAGGLWFEKAFTVTVSDVNEAPTDIALSNSTVAENAAANTAVGNLSSTDPDTSNTFSYTLVAGTGDTDNAAFNISTNSLRLTGSANFEAKSSYSVRIRSTDSGGLWFEKPFTVTVTDVNEAPTDIALSNSTVAENAAANTAVGNLSSTDPDTGLTFSYTLVAGVGDTDNAAFNISTNSLRLTASANFEAKSSYSVRIRSTDAGGLWFEKAFTVTVTDVNEAPTDIALSNSTVAENAAANTAVGNLSSTDPDTSNTFTYTLVAGTGDTDNAAFNISTNSLRLTGSANFEAKSSYSVRVRSTDAGGLWFEKAFTVTVSDVNEAPTDIVLSSSTVAENAAANTAVGNLSSTDPDTGLTFSYTLVAGAGDTDNAAFNISTNSLRLTGSANFEAKSSYSVRVRSTDGGGLWFEKAFTVTVTDVNEAPTDIALSNSTVAENAAANTAVGNLSSTDPDSGNTFSYTLVAGEGDTDNAAFNISTNSLRLTGSANFEAKSSYSVRIRSTDGGGLWFEKAFTVTVSDVNEAPTDIALSNSSVAENAGANAVVGGLFTADPDSGSSFTYTLVTGLGDNDNAAFNISTNSLRLTASANFEAKSSYSVRIRSTDAGGLWFEKAFTVTVTDVNEAPTDIALSNSTVAENAAANTAVGNLSSTDPDTGNTFTYTLVAGTGDTDNAAFNISGSSLRLTGSANFEAKSSYSLRVRSTDAGGLWFEKALTVSVTNVNEAPTDIALSTSTVAENTPANTTVGNLSTTDPDTSDTFTYTLVAGTGDTDNAAFNISTSSLRLTGSANFEAKSSYSVRIRSTDSGGLSTEKSMSVSVSNVAEAPTISVPTDGFVVTSIPETSVLSGTCDAGSAQVVLEGDVVGGQTTSCVSGQFSFSSWSVTSVEGSKTVTVAQTVGGTKRTVSIGVTFQAPVPPESAASLSSQFISGLKATITGSCDSSGLFTTAVTTTLGRVQQTACVSGALTVLLTDLPEGRNSLTLTATVTRMSNGATRVTTASYNQQFFCPRGYVGVPGKFSGESDVTGLGHINAAANQADVARNPTRDFCVMKYPAKVATSSNGGQSPWEPVYDGNKTFTMINYWPDSRADSTPWGNITRDQAIDRCKVLNEALGLCTIAGCYSSFDNTVHGFRLMSNTQWQVMARNLEASGPNWTSGTVGTGFLWRGHTDNAGGSSRALHGQAFGSSLGLANPRSDSGSSDYFGTGNSDSQNTSGTAGWQERRRFVLRNGSSLWDVAGNVWQWVQDDNGGTVGSIGASNQLFSASAWWEYDNTSLTSADRLLFSSLGGYLSAQNAGRVLGALGIPGMVIRGGVWDGTGTSGIFSANMYVGNNQFPHVGFRCAFVPPPVPAPGETTPPTVSVSRVDGAGVAAGNTPVTVASGGAWNLNLSVSDSANTGALAPRVRVEVRRKMGITSTDFPLASDPIYRAGMNHPGLFNKPDTNDLTQQSSVVSLTDGKLYLSNETAWTFDEATGRYARNDGSFANYLVTAIDPSGNIASTTYSVEVIQSCPPGYVGVPGNSMAGLGSASASVGNADARLDPSRDICVMKYPAKVMSAGTTAAQSFVGGRFEPILNGNNAFIQDSSGGNSVGYNYATSAQFDASIRYLPVSRFFGTPWVSISRNDAVGACRAQQMQYFGAMPDTSAGTGFQLMSNTQWQVVARNGEGQAINWSGNAVGNGVLNRGHSDNVISATEPINSWCFGCTNPSTSLSGIAHSWNDANYYFATGNTASGAWNTLGASPSAGSEQKRNHSLSNGQSVWDLSGNVWHWMGDDYISLGVNPTISGGWWEFSNSAYFPLISFVNRLIFAPLGSFTSSQNAGQLYGGSSGPVIRGGDWGNSGSGLFSFILNRSTSEVQSLFGFRCVYVPTAHAGSLGGNAPQITALGRVNDSDEAIGNNPVTIAGGGSWNLRWQVRDTESTAANISVAVRRKITSSSTDFPTTDDATYSTGTGATLTSLLRETAWQSQSVTNNNTYVNYLITATDQSGNRTSETFSVSNSASCPVGYVGVPGNPTNGLGNASASVGNASAWLDPSRAFCVMKYPAKNVSNVATSVPSNPPWVMVTNSSAATQCSNLGSQFRLISNTQWQVVARNAESVGSNWSGGAVGVGSLPQGHIDNAPASLLDNSSMDSDPYYGTNNNAGQGVGAGWEQRRTNRLSNGSVVWDFSGNVWQWVSDSFSPNPAPSGSAWNWVEFSDTTAFPTAAPATNRLLLAPLGSFTSAQRVGRVFWGNAGSLTFVRGCNWNCPDKAGLFSTSTYTSSGNHVGFRCVYMP